MRRHSQTAHWLVGYDLSSLDSRLRGNDKEGAGMTVKGTEMTTALSAGLFFQSVRD